MVLYHQRAERQPWLRNAKRVTLFGPWIRKSTLVSPPHQGSIGNGHGRRTEQIPLTASADRATKIPQSFPLSSKPSSPLYLARATSSSHLQALKLQVHPLMFNIPLNFDTDENTEHGVRHLDIPANSASTPDRTPV